MARAPGLARGLAWGDIRLVEFGRPDRTRPALVLSRTNAIPHLHAVTVAPITRTIRGIPTELVLDVGDGLKERSVAKLDALQTIPKTALGRYLGSVLPARKAELRAALLFALWLEAD